MLYFSELKNRKVYTEDNVFVGKLTDLVFRASQNPIITKLIIKSKVDENMMVSAPFLKKIRGDYGDIIVRKNFETSELTDDELYVGKNLLDNQIIDIEGSKVVRVNDVAIQDKHGADFYIAGVDIGLVGLFRWFGIEHIANKILGKVGIKITSRFLSWADIQTLELTRGHVKIKKEQSKLASIKPEDLADYLEETNLANVKQVLTILEADKRAEVLNELNLNYKLELFRQFEPEESAKIMNLMDPEESADVLAALQRKKQQTILALLNEGVRNEVEYLLKLSRTPIGDIISTEYLAVSSTMTAQEVINQIRAKTKDFSSFAYVYVLNDQRQLVGAFALHDLILQNPDTQVFKFMTQNLSVIYLTTPPVVALRKLLKYTLFALPVIDSDRHMIGIVIFDDVSGLINKV